MGLLADLLIHDLKLRAILLAGAAAFVLATVAAAAVVGFPWAYPVGAAAGLAAGAAVFRRLYG